jgi:hypothetical protein
MALSKYAQLILDTLQGRTDELRDIPPEALDWSGVSAVLRLYRQTSGEERNALIRAIGEVIQKHPAPPAIIADLIHIASALDVSQVEPQIRKLQTETFASEENLRSEISNYLAFRELKTLHLTGAFSSAANGKPRAPKAKTARKETKTGSVSSPPRKTIGRKGG